MVGKNILRYRLLRNLKPEHLGKLVGLSHSQINRIENGKSEINVATLLAIARALQVSPIDLFEEKDLFDGNDDLLNKYGPLEQHYIRFLIYQIEALRLQNAMLIEENAKLLNSLEKQLLQMNRLMTHVMGDQKKSTENTNIPLGGGGVVKKIMSN